MGKRPAKPSGSARRLREAAIAGAGRLGAAAGHETRARRLAWSAIGALLVLAPLGFNLVRQPGFEASRTIVPQAVGPYPPTQDPSYYRALLADPELRKQTELHAGKPFSDYDVSIRRGPEPASLTVTAEGDSPRSTQTFVNALGPQISIATKRQLARVASQDRARLRERLLDTGLSREARRTLEVRLRSIKRLGDLPPSRVSLGSQAPLPPLRRWTDRLADALPGDFPARPSPAWAALAGFLVAAALWAVWHVVLPPRRD